ncbi:MAG: thioesterase family protein [Burkholderiaceae bacterium]
MKNTAHNHALDEPYTAALRRIFEEQIVFNSVIGLKITSITAELVSGTITMQPKLIGHFSHQRLHGGVISAGLDAMGGLAIMARLGQRHQDDSLEARTHRFNRLGTIDLRIDYLRPAVGENFVLTAETIRLGSRVGTTQMRFIGSDDQLLAIGTGAYIVS